MKATKGLLSWAGLEVSEPGAFGLGLGFALSFERGNLSDCLPEHLIITNAARTLGIESQEFGTVSREKAIEHLRDHLSRGTPVAGRLGGEMVLFTGADENAVMVWDKAIHWEELERGMFVGEGPVKAFLYTYKKTKHFPPLGIAMKKALAEMARRFLFPDKPTRGIKVANILSGQGKIEWAHAPALGHGLLAGFMEEAGRSQEAKILSEMAGRLRYAPAGAASEIISEEKGIFSRLL